MKIFRKLEFKLILMSTIPIIVVGFLFMIFGIRAIETSTSLAQKKTLTGICNQLTAEFIQRYPGNYYEEDGKFYSDGTDISEALSLLDQYKESFNAEVTIFFKDVSVLTTICDNNGNRIIGTRASDSEIYNTVRYGKVFSSDNTEINGKIFHVVYQPLRGQDGTVVGMVFAGITDDEFKSIIRSTRIEIIIIAIAICLIVVVIVTIFSKDTAAMLTSIKEYLGSLIDSKTVEFEMPEELLKRNDEIGDLGRYAVSISDELQIIIGRDPLTGLFNRRSGRALLDKLWDNAKKEETTFSIVMSDIDHFKYVNDTYGHDAGDMVLKEISEIFLKHIATAPGSYPIRWGGEEILLGLMLPLGQAINLVTVMMEEIRNHEYTFNGQTFKVTVTFGISSSKTHDDVHGIIVSADEKLYRGKKEGRDRLIF